MIYIIFTALKICLLHGRVFVMWDVSDLKGCCNNMTVCCAYFSEIQMAELVVNGSFLTRR